MKAEMIWDKEPIFFVYFFFLTAIVTLNSLYEAPCIALNAGIDCLKYLLEWRRLADVRD